ncbi:MAG: GNAT family N-acetyltransferase [Candidatus Hodarchaeota archaeon]
MNLHFRELILDDLSNIKELSDSMGMLNDPKIGDTAEALIKDPKCFLYGAFSSKSLVGVGGLREKTQNLAWIEAIRDHGEYQKKGIGTALLSYGEQLTREKNYLKVGYQTVTENKGSCRIGEKLGFKRNHEMIAFGLGEKDISEDIDSYPDLEETPIETALTLLQDIPNEPREEICIGWSYAPLNIEYFQSEPQMKFFFHDKTIMLEFVDRSIATNKIDMAKTILYGSIENIPFLLKGFIKRNLKLEVSKVALCPKELTEAVLGMGFQYARVWTGNHNVVVLFTKKF